MPYALEKRKKEVLSDIVCVDCGRLADRKCKVCGDIYCSVRWPGNLGCFENFHLKGNRMLHEIEMFEVREKPAEILELEERAKAALDAKKAQDLVNLEEARRELAAEELAKLRIKEVVVEKPADNSSSIEAQATKKKDLKTMKTGRCHTIGCTKKVYELMPFCPRHCTPPNVLTVVKDPIKAAQIVADAEMCFNAREARTKKRIDKKQAVRDQRDKKERRQSMLFQKLEKIAKKIRKIE